MLILEIRGFIITTYKLLPNFNHPPQGQRKRRENYSGVISVSLTLAPLVLPANQKEPVPVGAIGHWDWWGRGGQGQPIRSRVSERGNNDLLMRVWPGKRLLDKTVILWVSSKWTQPFCWLQNNVAQPPFLFNAPPKDLVPDPGPGFSSALEEEEVCGMSVERTVAEVKVRAALREDKYWSLEESGESLG